MTSLTPYLHFAGNAREAITFYESVFGGSVVLHEFAEFERTDGPANWIAHSMLQGPVEVFCADTAEGEPAFSSTGLLFALLGTAQPATMERWFAQLSEGGTVIDPLQKRPWGDHDGQVIDRFGVPWLIGYQPE